MKVDEQNNYNATLQNLHETKTCPYCSEEILTTAIKCKHCGSDLSDATPYLTNPISIAIYLARRASVYILIIGAVFLAITNPTKSDFTSYVKGSLELRDSGNDRMNSLFTGIATVAVTTMTDRSNFLLFSVFDVDTSMLRAFKSNVPTLKYLGIGGTFVPMSLDSIMAIEQQDSGKPPEPVAHIETPHTITLPSKYGTLSTVRNNETGMDLLFNGAVVKQHADEDQEDFSKVAQIDIKRELNLSSNVAFQVEINDGGNDPTASNYCVIVQTKGRNKYVVTPRMECGEAYVLNDRVRVKQLNPFELAEGDDFGVVEVNDGEVTTVQQPKSESYYKKKFENLTSEMIFNEYKKDYYIPEANEMNVIVGHGYGGRMICFKFRAIKNPVHDEYYDVLKRSCG